MRFVVMVAMLGMLPMAAQAQEAPPPPKPKPIGNPGEWIPPNSYPPGARASAEEGRVSFTLDVDESGRAIDCKITATSESPLLDETTCHFMVANARFEPPRDKKNRPIASKWSSSVRWKLDPAPVVAPPPPPPAPPPPAAVAPPPPKPAPKPGPTKRRTTR